MRFASPQEVVELIDGEVPDCRGANLVAQRNAFLRGLGLASPVAQPGAEGSADVILVKALYLHGLDQVVVVDRSEDLSAPVANYTLAHEFVHAIQDQTVDLSALVEGHGRCFDARLALVAAVEGEAVRAESIVREALFGRTLTDVELNGEADERVERANERSLARGPAAESAFSLFPYAYGGRWAARQGRPEAFGELLIRAPRDTRGHMDLSSEFHPTKMGAPPAEAEAPETDVAGVDRLGAWLVYNLSALTSPSDERVAAGLERTSAYLDDTLVLGAGDGSTFKARWRTEWADDAHAAAFGAALEPVLAGGFDEATLEVDGNAVVLEAIASTAAL